MTKKTVSLSLLKDAETYVKKLLTEKLSDDHRYHNLPHTLAVRKNCLQIGKRLDLTEEELEILELACLFHDVGFVEVYSGHEAVSHRMAKEFLEAHEYPDDKLQRVLRCIDVTFLPNQPADHLGKIIRDADLANLGSPSYPVTLAALRHEWQVFLRQTFGDRDWYRLNFEFLKKQRFYTSAAEELFGANKQTNEKYLKRMAKEVKERKKEKDATKIQGNRGAQMMFKTALRNHLDLSSLADSKANIMISVNSGILTVGVPLAFRFIGDLHYNLLYLPLGILLITCLISLVFATLATRPVKMKGYTTKKEIESGESNLFFFGNFYGMTFKDYTKGIQEVIQDEDKLENSIQRDLFFLGKSLGRKYRQLRTCYTIFMYGMILAIIALIVIIIQGYSQISAAGLDSIIH